MNRPIVGFLVVSASGDMRVTKRRVPLAWDEVAYRVVVQIPEGWATVRGEIAITMPEPPAGAEVTDS